MSQFTNDVEGIQSLAASYQQLRKEISKVIVGQDDVVKYVLLSIFCDSHSLLVGVPGLAKTLLVKTVSDALELNFKRVQFTPDLMPSDIIGAEVLNENRQFQLTEVQFLRILFWQMRSTNHRKKHNQRYWKPCRNDKLRLPVNNIN